MKLFDVFVLKCKTIKNGLSNDLNTTFKKKNVINEFNRHNEIKFLSKSKLKQHSIISCKLQIITI